jgi:hypothetical protein
MTLKLVFKQKTLKVKAIPGWMKCNQRALTARVVNQKEANVMSMRLIKNGFVLKDFMRTGKSLPKYLLQKFMILKI